MKKILLFSALILASIAVACSRSGNKAVEDAKTPAQSLIERLEKIRDAGLIAFGHHDDTAYGMTWEFVPDSSDVFNVVGDYPAIVNWDLGLVEWESPRQLDGVPFDLMRREIRKHHDRGGINSISWHPRNPVTKGNSWDTSESSAVFCAVTPGYAENDTLVAWVERAADFIASLRDADGNLIPVIFRPWHEHTGSWFWWGREHCTPDQYKALWAITRNIFDSKGLDNIVWAYSPDKTGCASVADYLERYPGDDYVDILGADVYYFHDWENAVDAFNTNMANVLEAATQVSRSNGKLIALTETGDEGLRAENWYTEILMPAVKQYPIVSITVWRNSMHKANHFYTPYPGHPETPDFIKFYQMPQTAFLKDIANIQW